MLIKFRILALLNLVYCYLPCMAFLFGWCRLSVSIPSSVLLVVMIYVYIKQMKNEDSVEIRMPVLIITLLSSLLVCVILGFGGVFANYYDYIKHSAVIQDMVMYDWPVYYQKNEPVMLTYYLGQYLIPSLFGKMFNNRFVAELLFGLFGWVGVYLLYLNLFMVVKPSNSRRQLLLMVMFFFFSGMLMPLKAIFKILVPLDTFELMDPHWFGINGWRLQYRSVLTSIRWVFPQYIVPCIGVAMLLNDKNMKYRALMILPSFISGTWGFLCLVMLVVLQYVIDCVKSKKPDYNIVSVQNITIALIGVVFLLYFVGNLSLDKPDYMKFSIILNPLYYLKCYIPFVLFMFGFYVLLVWKDFRNDSLFLSMVIMLLLIPCFKMGYYNDFVMCTSMPALFLCASFVFKFLFSTKARQTKRHVLLCICLLLASSSPIIEFLSLFPLKTQSFSKRSLVKYTDMDAEVDDDCMKYNYFTYYPEKTLFYKYIAKK